MGDLDLYNEDKIIFQHNAITSGRYDYSACMLDVLFMVLAGLEKEKSIYTVSVKDIELITGRKWNYQQLYESTEAIGSRMFHIDNDRGAMQLWLFSRVQYLTGQGAFEVKINEDAIPYFFDLKNNFTAMNLKSLLGCSSKYAKRLYALVCQWRSVGYKKLEITELKKMLGLIDTKGVEQYTRFSDFQIRVLDVAKKQINENTNVNFDYELIKRGRKYHYIILHFKGYKPIIQSELPLDFTKNVDYLRKFEMIKKYDINESIAKKWAETKEAWLAFNNAKDVTLIEVQKGNVRVENSAKYIVGIMKKNGFE